MNKEEKQGFTLICNKCNSKLDMKMEYSKDYGHLVVKENGKNVTLFLNDSEATIVCECGNKIEF